MISSDWQSQIFEKKLTAWTWAKWTKIVPDSKFFCQFLKFGSLVFPEIAYNDSLQQCLTSSKCKTHKKIGVQIWAKGAKIEPKTRFLAIFSSLVC